VSVLMDNQLAVELERLEERNDRWIPPCLRPGYALMREQTILMHRARELIAEGSARLEALRAEREAAAAAAPAPAPAGGAGATAASAAPADKNAAPAPAPVSAPAPAPAPSNDLAPLAGERVLTLPAPLGGGEWMWGPEEDDDDEDYGGDTGCPDCGGYWNCYCN